MILSAKRKTRISSNAKMMWKMRQYYLLVLPTIALFIIFNYIPMYGVTLAFKDFKFTSGILFSPWVGLKHFIRLFNNYEFWNVLTNTVLISLYRIIYGFPIPIIFALLLNEVKNQYYKKIVQTVSYLPYFISWIVIAGLMKELLSQERGVINYFIVLFGGKPIYFLGEAGYFRSILIASGIWRSMGWDSVVYLAAITSIDVQLYEAAKIDGAKRFQMMRFITLPGIMPIISILFILGLGDILNAGFDQIFNLMNAITMKTGDILDTYVYRVGLIKMDYSYSTAVGFFKNIVGFLMIIGANLFIRKMGDGEYGVW